MEHEENKKKPLYIIIGTLAAASIVFRFGLYLTDEYYDKDFSQLSILFVGLPTLIAFLIVKYSKKKKTLLGIVTQTITIFLLLTMVLFGEGIPCILMAAPLFYGAGAIVVKIKERLDKGNNKVYSSIAIVLFVLIATEGDLLNSKAELQQVENEIVLTGNHPLTELEKEPDVLSHLPKFFKLGFPTPEGISGNGLNIGDTREIGFRSQTKGLGKLKLKVIDKTENQIVFLPISDDTHIDHWLTWKKVTVKTQYDVATNQTTISWQSDYKCDLGPKWYFEPIESYAVSLMNEHLIHSYFGVE